MKKNIPLLASCIALLSLSSAFANTRLNEVMWTDRGAANPPLSENSSTINDSIERFWNLPVPEQPIRVTTTQLPRSYSAPIGCAPYSRTPSYWRSHSSRPIPHNNHYHQNAPTVVTTQPNHTLVQHKDQRDKRGYFGINLFNMIPLIDIVTGSSETNSSDHVEASR